MAVTPLFLHAVELGSLRILVQKKRYEGVRFNIISVMRWVVKFPDKTRYEALV